MGQKVIKKVNIPSLQNSQYARSECFRFEIFHFNVTDILSDIIFQAPYIIYIEVLAHDVEEDLELQEQYHENLLADHYRSMNGNDDTVLSTPFDRTKFEEGLGSFECGYSPESSEYDGTLSVNELNLCYNALVNPISCSHIRSDRLTYR